MMTSLRGVPEQHGVTSPAAYAAKHRRDIQKKRARGWRMEESTSHAPVTAYVDAGRWIANCPCGAGMSVEPGWPEARCFGCGTVHDAVVFPSTEEVDAITEILLARQNEADQNFRPQEGETVDTLRNEERP
jgi:hypothetical protein